MRFLVHAYRNMLRFSGQRDADLDYRYGGQASDPHGNRTRDDAYLQRWRELTGHDPWP